jgi:hypothetical protein
VLCRLCRVRNENNVSDAVSATIVSLKILEMHTRLGTLWRDYLDHGTRASFYGTQLCGHLLTLWPEDGNRSSFTKSHVILISEYEVLNCAQGHFNTECNTLWSELFRTDINFNFKRVAPCGGGLEWRNVIPVRYKLNSCMIQGSRKISLFSVWRRVRMT